MGQPYQQNPQGMGYPTGPAMPYGQPQNSDPWANGNLPTGAYDGADPFDNAVPDTRGQRAALADPRTGLPVIHTDGEPVYVSPPSLRTLGIGTLLIIVPKKIERDVKNNRPGAWKPTFNRMTADVIVCDGQGRKFGGDPTRGLDDPLGPYPVPCVIQDMWIDKDGIIERVEKVLGTGFKIGRIVKVKTSNDRAAWNFNAPHDDPAIAGQIVQSLRPMWQAYLDNQLPILNLKTLAEQYGVKPGATAQAQPAQQTAPVASYSPNAPATPNPYMQQQPYGQLGQAQPVPAYGNAQNPVALTNPPYAGGSTVPVPMGQPQPQWPPMQPGQNTAPVQQAAPVQPVSAPQAPVQDWTLTVALPPQLEGFRAAWATGLSREVREQMLAQCGVVRPGAGAYEQSAPPAPVTGGPGY